MQLPNLCIGRERKVEDEELSCTPEIAKHHAAFIPRSERSVHRGDETHNKGPKNSEES